MPDRRGAGVERTARGVIGATVLIAAIISGIVMWRYAGTLPADFELEFKEARPAPGSDAEGRISWLTFQVVVMTILGLWALFGALPQGDTSLQLSQRRPALLWSSLPGALVAAALPAALFSLHLPVQMWLAPLAVSAVGAVLIGVGLCHGSKLPRAAFRGAGLAVVGMVLATPFVMIVAVVVAQGGRFYLALFLLLQAVVGVLLPAAGLRLYARGSRLLRDEAGVRRVGEWIVALLALALAVNVLLGAFDFTPYQDMVRRFNESLIQQGWDPIPIPGRP